LAPVLDGACGIDVYGTMAWLQATSTMTASTTSVSANLRLPNRFTASRRWNFEDVTEKAGIGVSTTPHVPSSPI